MSNSVPFSRLLNGLFTKSGPQTIYSYHIKPSIKLGASALSIVFIGYGCSFASWSWSSAFEIHKNAIESGELNEKSWLGKAKFYALTFSPFVLVALPLTLSIASVTLCSRIVTEVKYLQPNKCQITRKGFFTGKPITVSRSITDIVRNPRTKVFTGVGPSGTEDKSSFVFFLTDKHPLTKFIWQKMYILPRSGAFYGNDGRIFDALFGGDSIRILDQLKRNPPKTTNTENSKNYQEAELDSIRNKRIINELAIDKLQKPKLHTNNASKIVQTTQKYLQDTKKSQKVIKK